MGLGYDLWGLWIKLHGVLVRDPECLPLGTPIHGNRRRPYVGCIPLWASQGPTHVESRTACMDTGRGQC